ncbi:uncharacterized protein EV154DRAFT_48856 [Mucor mucedo]|uniref:uncharacterized protein n=1 Tax=Mucor mucedo TaxID=29922 RepID=UPI00221E81F7|nr:uncharacterized protein EV154DRAFT_48856 [Mucor mucedo]KAI7894969.1 hypothetical protein EV154DRAFT_48856 [Mucor mucedo]
MAEICKRQLHLRLQKSSSTKEHCAFGILVGGMMSELTKLELDNGKYNYSILKTIEIPGRKEAYESIEKIFESFKLLNNHCLLKKKSHQHFRLINTQKYSNQPFVS